MQQSGEIEVGLCGVYQPRYLTRRTVDVECRKCKRIIELAADAQPISR